jgi:hypothetical protein
MPVSSPNRMVWQYFAALRRSVDDLDRVSDQDEQRQEVALCIMLSITVVEAFLNIFFRVVVSDPAFSRYAQRVLTDLNQRRSLDKKIRDWPRDILGRGLNFDEPAPKSFLAVKNLRNSLMHFTSSHESLELAEVQIQGLANTSGIRQSYTSRCPERSARG